MTPAPVRYTGVLAWAVAIGCVLAAGLYIYAAVLPLFT